jgi:serine/threonine protein kinase
MSATTSPDQRCPTCGAILPTNTLGGQCVSCLLRLGLKAGAGPVEEQSPPSPYEGPIKYFGDFELTKEIARGGMGVVWRARQVSLNRLVALKLLVEGRFASEAAIKRFEFEAESAANLDHPNIVPIYEVGHNEGWPYLVMKLLDGGNLGERMAEFSLVRLASAPTDVVETNPQTQRGALPELLSSKSDLRDRQLRIAALLAKVARAVHFAHQHGILHRDLKPSNILIDALGEPHVTDFGVAKAVDADGRLTLTGAILGSPYYMAPEQAAGKSAQLSTAADTYSLGIILFELLTGRLPFQAETPVATLKLVMEGEPPRLRSFNPAVDPDLETICLKCLEKDPAKRYPSGEALAEDLDFWQQDLPITARRSSPSERAYKWIKREPLKAGAIASIVLSALISSYITGRISAGRLPHMAIQHAVATANNEGQFLLKVVRFKEDNEHRVTDNFWRYGFDPPTGLAVRLDFLGVTPELLPSLRCLIRADQPGRPDPPRSGIITNGQTFLLKYESDLDRNFYVGSVGWSARELLATSSNAVIRLTLVTNKTVQTTAPIEVRP